MMSLIFLIVFTFCVIGSVVYCITLIPSTTYIIMWGGEDQKYYIVKYTSYGMSKTTLKENGQVKYFESRELAKEYIDLIKPESV